MQVRKRKLKNIKKILFILQYGEALLATCGFQFTKSETIQDNKLQSLIYTSSEILPVWPWAFVNLKAFILESVILCACRIALTIDRNNLSTGL